jgi:class 3 adenylate cyclase/tetratricopeptide (TPR) repeat protein
MSDELRIWLEQTGLAQYAEIFVANDIDLDLLDTLSDEDLKELGLSLGHRRRLLRAIAERSAILPSAMPPVAETTVAGGEPIHQAERRQITVLFCDLVGSTELSRRHDPEDLRELIRRYQDAVSGAVVRHGGYIANFLGDGIVAYFGWPRAGEDDAAEAIRAALDAVVAVRDLSLQARAGLASGMVVVGDLDAAGRRQTGAIAGETPNLAARLQALAGPDEVVIGALTQQLVGGAFILDDLGTHSVKGIEDPVQVWRVLAERSVESRFEARAGRLTRFVGREHEVALLLDRFERAVAGEGQVVLLSGEAGIGKSRIIRQLHERLSATPHTRLRFQCSPSHTDSALYPFIRHLEYAAAFLPDDGPEGRLDKLEALLAEATENVAESARLLAPLLSLPAERYGAVEMSPEQHNERTLRVLIDQLLGLAAKAPVLYVLEDAHWLDPTTREVVARTLGRIGDARVLILITHRPEFQPDWRRYPHVTSLTLTRLSRPEGVEIVRAAGGEMLSEEVLAGILRRADGVPLYIEELTRSVIESGGTASGSEVPETLQASLLARLDRLGGEAKDLAQIAAVIGREFRTALLCAVADKPRAMIVPLLDRLLASDVVLRAGNVVEDAYAFRHALIHDAAYESLLLSRRREYHRVVADVIEQQFLNTIESEPEILAQHFTAAIAPERAIPYWLRAGKHALGRFAVSEAATHLERGLELARRLPDGTERSRAILDLLLPLGDALYRTHRRDEAQAAFTEAAELARALVSPADLTRAALGVEDCQFLIYVPEHESVALLEGALAALGDSKSVDHCRLLSRLGRALFSIGMTERASELLRDGVDLARQLADPDALYDAIVCQHITTAGYPWSAREFPARRKSLDEMLAVAEALADPERISEVEGRRIPAFLEMADLTAFETAQANKAETLRKHGLTGIDWNIPSVAAMAAILHGEFAEGERLAAEAVDLAGGVDAEVVTGIYGLQMFTIRREQGRLAEVAPLLKHFIDENPRDAVWRPGLALIASDLGFKDAARKAFSDLAAAGFAFPIDSKRNITLSYLAEVCVRIGDADRAEQLYDLLLPYRDLAMVVPTTTVCCGANARYLGMLASAIGDWAAADEHFVLALDMDERLRAWPWLAHTKHEFALMLRARGRAADRRKADKLLAEALASAERIGMPALQTQIRSLGN